MKNVIVLGSGRSGTSMLAGMFRSAGYFMGTDYITPRDSNPKGFFEGREVNDINEKLLQRVVPTKHPLADPVVELLPIGWTDSRVH